MFGRALSDSTSGLKKPYGIRYNPSGSMDDSFNYKRPGAWQNITVVGGYDWSGGFNRHSLGYVNNGATKVLVHASISSTNNTVNLATVNDSNMNLYGTGLWVMVCHKVIVCAGCLRLSITIALFCTQLTHIKNYFL